MLHVSRELARHGAVGKLDCTPVSLCRGICPKCGHLFKGYALLSCADAVSGDDRSDILFMCVRIPDRPMTRSLQTRRDFRLGPG